jgi:hypothetical protein
MLNPDNQIHFGIPPHNLVVVEVSSEEETTLSVYE